MNKLPRTLNEACVLIEDCLHATAPIQDDGHPLIRTPNIGKGRLDLTDVQRVSDETYHHWTRRAIPQTDDLILAREAPAGNVAIVKEGQRVCLGQRTVLLRPDPCKVDADYLCYFLLAPVQQGALLGPSTGATAAHVNMWDIRRLPLVGMHILDDQRRIGPALASFDDLIVNNTRRIALLERSARLLYEEWFVWLRFPGRDRTPLVDGVPQGWTRETARTVLDVQSGGTPSTEIDDYWDGDIPFYTPADAVSSPWVIDTEKSLTPLGLEKCNSRLFPRGTLFITARGTVGNLNLAQRPMAMNQSCYGLVARTTHAQAFAYYAMDAAVRQFQKHAGGAVFDAIIIDTFKLIRLLVPPKPLVNRFEEAVRPVLAQIEILLLQNRELRKARDLLLPRLMSGTASV